MRAPDRHISRPFSTSVSRSMASPLATLAFAMLAAAGVLLPWAEWFHWAKSGWSYNQGLVALVAAAESAIVCALRASENIDRRRYVLFGLLCALVGLGATVWFYLDIVGSTDPAASNLPILSYRMPRIAGGVGLYVSMAGFVGQVVALLWHLDHGVRRFVRSVMGSPLTTAAFIVLAGVGVLLPWEEHPLSSKPGWSFNQGLVALVAAAEAGIVCGLRVSGNIRAAPYALLGLLCAFAGLGAIVWFHDNVIGDVDPSGYRMLLFWLNGPRLGFGSMVYVSAAGFIGQIAVLLWQTWQAGRDGSLSLRLPRPRMRPAPAE